MAANRALRTRADLADRTHCNAGHAFNEENTYRYPKTGARECRACRNERHRKMRIMRAGDRVIHPRYGARKSWLGVDFSQGVRSPGVSD